MDEKKVIEKLAEIVQKQQKIIMKLAQALPPDALPTGGSSMTPGKEHMLGNEPPPTKLDPSKVVHDPAKVYYEAMSPAQRNLLAFAPQAVDSNMNIRFKPNQATQANYDSLFKLLKDLTSQNKIQQAYNLRSV